MKQQSDIEATIDAITREAWIAKGWHLEPERIQANTELRKFCGLAPLFTLEEIDGFMSKL